MRELQIPFRVRQIIAFAAVYTVWGSTYLAIRFAIETLPGFIMAGVRFLTAGLVLYIWMRWRGAPAPTRRQWRSALLIGGLLLLGGNGAVVWAEQFVPSGLTALLVGTEPLWVAALLLLGPGGERPSARTFGALLVGFSGAAILAAPAELVGGAPIYLPGVLVIVLGAISWACGSLYARRADLPKSLALTTAMQMLCGGALLTITAVATGELRGFEPAAVSAKSLLALAYLIVFGALIAYSAYGWLLRNTEPTLVATYAYVNPVVAVFLGWLLAGEPLGPRTWVATPLIVGAVILVGRARRRPPVAPPTVVPASTEGAGTTAPPAILRAVRYDLDKCA